MFKTGSVSIVYAGTLLTRSEKITFFKRKRIKEILVHSGPVHSKLVVGIDSGFHD